MTVRKTKGSTDKTLPWADDSNKTVHYEFQFKNKLVTPGTVIKLKRDKTQYRFVCYVHDVRLDSTWIELMSVNGYKATRIENISQVVSTTKRSRAKKVNIKGSKGTDVD